MCNLCKTRMDFIDSIKGFAIFLVVMGHVIAWQFENFYHVSDSGEKLPLFWWLFIYSFHMPLFMFVSGYLFPRSFTEWNSIKNYIFRKTYTLAIPFIVASFLGNVIMGGADYWFLKTLYLIIIINLIGEIISSKFRYTAVVDVIYYMAVFVILRLIVRFLPENIIQVVDFDHINSFIYLPFCIGTFCKKYEYARRVLENKHTFTVAIITYSLLLYGNINGFNDRLFWLIPWIACPLSGIICCWQLFKFQFRNGWIVKCLQYLGRHSLEIYIIHFFFAIKMPIVGDVVMQMVNTDKPKIISTALIYQLMHSITISVIICVLCIVVFKVLKYSSILSVVIFGRKNNK